MVIEKDSPRNENQAAGAETSTIPSPATVDTPVPRETVASAPVQPPERRGAAGPPAGPPTEGGGRPLPTQRRQGDEPGGRPRRDQRGRESGREDRPRGPSNAARQLVQEIVERAHGANPLLKIQLTGVVAVVLSSCGETFLFDWMGERLQLRAGPMENPDCIIHLTEQNLLQVASGDLNPQLGMLSDKIRVEGKLSFAVYFFNLVVPRGGGA